MRRRFEEQRLEEDRGVYDDAVTGLSDARSAERAASEAYHADLAAWARASHSVDTQEVVDALGLPPFEPDRVEAVVNELRTDVQTGYGSWSGISRVCARRSSTVSRRCSMSGPASRPGTSPTRRPLCGGTSGTAGPGPRCGTWWSWRPV